MVIEIADSSIEYDSAVKAKLYAQAGIAELWIIDVSARVITIYSQPSTDRYARKDVKSEEETMVIQAFPDIELSVRDILG